MGMYTELHFNARLKPGTPAGVINLLGIMVSGNGSPDDPVPDHPLFHTESRRWRWMLQSDSYYFDADTHSTLRLDGIAGQYFLCIRCNLKNYGGEIDKFVDWITPHLDADDGEFLGFSRYEEEQWPTLIHHPKRFTTTENLT